MNNLIGPIILMLCFIYTIYVLVIKTDNNTITKVAIKDQKLCFCKKAAINKLGEKSQCKYLKLYQKSKKGYHGGSYYWGENYYYCELGDCPIIENKNYDRELLLKKSEFINEEDIIRKNCKSMSCPRCGGDLKYRSGKHGNFYGCSNYPKCTFSRSSKEQERINKLDKD